MALTSPEEEKPSATKEVGKTAGTGVELFPVQLMSILNEGKHSDVIEWLPDGNGFVIKDKKKCLEQVLSVYFGLSKYPSFTRRMKRWAFVHHQRGHKTACYFHPYFSRQNPSMCLEMKCNPQKKYGARSKNSRREQMFQNRSVMYPSNNHNMHQRRQHQAHFASNVHPNLKMPPLHSNKFETSVYPSMPNTSTQFSPSQVFHSGGMQAVSQEQQFTAGPQLYTDGFSQQNTSYLPNASMPQPSSYAPVNMHQASPMNTHQHQSHLNNQHQQQINQKMRQTYQHSAQENHQQQMNLYRQNQQQPNPASMSNQRISPKENHIPQPPPAPAIYSPVMRTLGQNQHQFHVPAAMNVSDGSQTNPGGLAYQQHQTHNYGRTDMTDLQNDISSLQMPQNPIQASQRPGSGINISPSNTMNNYATYANQQQQQQQHQHQHQHQRQMNMGNDFNSQQQMKSNFYRYS